MKNILSAFIQWYRLREIKRIARQGVAQQAPPYPCLDWEEWEQQYQD